MKVNIALLTVTDTRTIDNDKSGAILVDKIKGAYHNLIDRKICKDNKDEIVLILKEWLNRNNYQLININQAPSIQRKEILIINYDYQKQTTFCDKKQISKRRIIPKLIDSSHII